MLTQRQKLQIINYHKILVFPHFGNDTEKPPITLKFAAAQQGLYVLESFALTDEYGTSLMAKAKT